VIRSIQESGYLKGKLLMAMPNMCDPRFDRAVICMCEHSAQGAMGLIINQPTNHIAFPELMEQLEIPIPTNCADVSINTGGPMEPTRGFVLHSADYLQDSTLAVSEIAAISATVDILRRLADGSGPRDSLLLLGYAGWGPGQLDVEIQENSWLHVESDADLLFHAAPEMKWSLALTKIGVDISVLSSEAGHA
jgi:putative transcriptional regulator